MCSPSIFTLGINNRQHTTVLQKSPPTHNFFLLIINCHSWVVGRRSLSMVKQETKNSPAERSETKFRGVRKRKWGKYVSEIRLPNSRERIWLGSYDSPHKAARAFDAALFCLRGPSATFNFPHNPLPNIISFSGAAPLTPAQIQLAAHRFAADPPIIKGSSSSHSSSETQTQVSQSQEYSSTSVSQQTGGLFEPSSLFVTMGPVNSSNSMSFNPEAELAEAKEYDIFPGGFDDFTNDYLLIQRPAGYADDDQEENNNYEEEYASSSSHHQGSSFLWNF